MCARNFVFNTMYIVAAIVSITPSNFCSFPMVFYYQKDISQKSHYQAITRVIKCLMNHKNGVDI